MLFQMHLHVISGFVCAIPSAISHELGHSSLKGYHYQRAWFLTICRHVHFCTTIDWKSCRTGGCSKQLLWIFWWKIQSRQVSIVWFDVVFFRAFLSAKICAAGAKAAECQKSAEKSNFEMARDFCRLAETFLVCFVEPRKPRQCGIDENANGLLRFYHHADITECRCRFARWLLSPMSRLEISSRSCCYSYMTRAANLIQCAEWACKRLIDLWI